MREECANLSRRLRGFSLLLASFLHAALTSPLELVGLKHLI
jgi:hypothetical protein